MTWVIGGRIVHLWPNRLDFPDSGLLFLVRFADRMKVETPIKPPSTAAQHPLSMFHGKPRRHRRNGASLGDWTALAMGTGLVAYRAAEVLRRGKSAKR